MEYKCLRLVWGCGLNVLDAMFDSICFKIKFVRWQSAANNTTTNKQARLWQTLCVFPSWAFLRPKCSKTLSECWYLICVGQWLWYKQDNPFQRVCKMLSEHSASRWVVPSSPSCIISYMSVSWKLIITTTKLQQPYRLCWHIYLIQSGIHLMSPFIMTMYSIEPPCHSFLCTECIARAKLAWV